MFFHPLLSPRLMETRMFGAMQRLASFEIRPINSNDAKEVATFLRENWGSTRVVSKGRVCYPEKLPGFVASIDDKFVGLLTYRIENRECEVVTLKRLRRTEGRNGTLGGRHEGSDLCKMQTSLVDNNKRQHACPAILPKKEISPRGTLSKSAREVAPA